MGSFNTSLLTNYKQASSRITQLWLHSCFFVCSSLALSPYPAAFACFCNCRHPQDTPQNTIIRPQPLGRQAQFSRSHFVACPRHSLCAPNIIRSPVPANAKGVGKRPRIYIFLQLSSETSSPCGFRHMHSRFSSFFYNKNSAPRPSQGRMRICVPSSPPWRRFYTVISRYDDSWRTRATQFCTMEVQLQTKLRHHKRVSEEEQAAVKN